MKKTLSLLLAFCMLGAAGAGCSSSEAPSSSGDVYKRQVFLLKREARRPSPSLLINV